MCLTRKPFEELAEIRFEIPDVHPHDVQPVGFKLTEDMSRAYVALGPAKPHCRRGC